MPQRARLRSVRPAMKANVSGIMKQLVPAFFIACPTASSRIVVMPAS